MPLSEKTEIWPNDELVEFMDFLTIVAQGYLSYSVELVM